ncbi:hypothetical protein [Mesorhizobium sp. J428]|uniref:hypothetical protein n=1 Tax=Mesorhizobium sp. J428 TaxID=2898440 RepID=UPI002151B502|nr:hypothetical protein [Mesorhizobium sp. J428]MCR5859730.1 hypothetical protein [Mesorhizobium sp. J428]
MRLKLLAATLLLSTALTSPAQAMPFIPAFIAGGAAAFGLGTAAGAAAGAYAGAALLGFQVAGFLTGPVGGLLLSTALQFGINALTPKPKAEGMQGNVNSAIPVRTLHFGPLLIGGSLIFAEAIEGRIYYAIHHGDCESELIADWFNDLELTFNGGGYVNNPEFVYKGDAYYTLERHDGAPGAVVSPMLSTRFPEWDEDHVGEGCCYTVIFVGAMNNPKAAAKLRRSQGPLGLGVPAYFREAYWGKVYDPRLDSTNGGDGPQRADDPTTWAYNDNWALVISTYRIHPDGWAKPPSSVNWARIAEQADICDVEVTGRGGYVQKRYAVATSIAFTEVHRDVEKRLLEAADGMRFTDSEGRWFVRCGYWEAPTITLTSDDIYSLDCAPSGNGESEHNVFVALYTDTRLGYKTTTSSAWKHPDHTGPGIYERRAPAVEIPEAPNHNQAVRVAKAVGCRTRSSTRLAITAGLRAAELREHRFVTIAIDDETFDGDYEIMSYDETEDGLLFPLQLVRSGSGNWTLEPGEEGPLPSYDNTIGVAVTVPEPTSFNVVAETVGASVRLRATFDPPALGASDVVVEYRPDAGGPWLEMVSNSSLGYALSDFVTDGVDYRARAYAEDSTGATSANVPDDTGLLVTATVDPVAPGVPVAFSATPDGDDVDLAATASNSANHHAIRFWRAEGAETFADAVDVSGAIYGPPNGSVAATDTDPGDGAWQFWATAENASQVQSAPTSPALLMFNLETETEDLLDRMSALPVNAGIVAIDAFIASLIAAGTWAKRDVLYVPIHNTIDSLLNWKGASYPLTNHNAVALDPWGAFQPNGTTSYLSTSYAPGSSAGVALQNDNHMMALSLTDTASNNVIVGNDNMSIVPRIPSNVIGVRTCRRHRTRRQRTPTAPAL